MRPLRIDSAVLGLAACVMAAGCGGGAAELTSLSFDQEEVSVNLGETAALSLVGHYSDGTEGPVEATVDWSSNAPAVAAVSDRGVVRAFAAGEAIITATVDALAAEASVRVTAPPLESISVAPAALLLTVGGAQALTVTGHHEGGVTSTLGTGLGWSSANPAIATVALNGTVTAVAEGSTQLTVTTQGHSATVPVTVTDAALTALRIAPDTFSVGVGGTSQLTAQGTFDDGSTLDVTQSVLWSSSDATVLTVDASGLARGVKMGAATVTARLGDFTATASGAVGLPTDPRVFVGEFGPGVAFQGFSGAVNALEVDAVELREGRPSLRIAVPGSGYSGGAFTTTAPRDLTGYNAVTFWAKASKAATLDKVGIGINNTPNTPYAAEVAGLPVTGTWSRFVVPIPLPGKLTSADGLFHFAASSSSAYTLWVSDLQYQQVDAAVLGAPRPSFASQTLTRSVGDTVTITGQKVLFAVDGADVTVLPIAAGWRYFSFSSSAPEVATVDDKGKINCVGEGAASISARLGSVDVAGSISLQVGQLSVPATAAPTPPARAAADVVSLWTRAYTNRAVDTWGAPWSNGGAGANVSEVTVGGQAVKKYSGLQFAGIEFFSGVPVIDASAMTHLHLDVWTPDSTVFKLKLVDFGADGLPGGTAANADAEHELVFDAGTTPALRTGTWWSLDLPLTGFTGLTERGHLAQLILSGSSSTVYLDNVYFYR